MKRISIIIPIFNTDKYLRQCVNSILKQKFKDYEIILVDDGSNDESPKICEHYSKRYNFITTIHKENGGLSDARNTGLKYSKGQYILFIDSDDYIFDGALDSIIKILDEKPDVDIIFLEAVKLFEDGRIIPLNDGYYKEAIFMKQQKEVLKHISRLYKFPGSACTKLVKRKLIEQHKLYFEKDQLSEDVDWTVRVLMAAQTFNYCDSYYYYYRQNRKESITNSQIQKNIHCLLYIINKWVKNNLKHNYENQFQEYINAYMAYEYLIVILMYGKLSKKDKKMYINEIKSLKWILRSNKTIKFILINYLISILKIDGITIFFRIYYRWKNSNQVS